MKEKLLENLYKELGTFNIHSIEAGKSAIRARQLIKQILEDVRDEPLKTVRPSGPAISLLKDTTTGLELPVRYYRKMVAKPLE